MIVAIAILWFLLILVINVVRDQNYYLKHRATNHNNRFWVRFLSLIPSIALFTIQLTGRFILELALSVTMVGLCWMNLFDGILNALRGEPWNYPGSDGPEDGVIENILQKYKWLQVVKVLAGAGIVYLYIQIQ